MCYFESRVRLNFPEDAPNTAFLTSPIRFVSEEEGKEHRKDEASAPMIA